MCKKVNLLVSIVIHSFIVTTNVCSKCKQSCCYSKLFVDFRINQFCNLRIRELSTVKVGSLLRISGQVVRTHPVHPELVNGTFICLDCQTVIKDVEQQFKYTQVRKFLVVVCHSWYLFLKQISIVNGGNVPIFLYLVLRKHFIANFISWENSPNNSEINLGLKTVKLLNLMLVLYIILSKCYI